MGIDDAPQFTQYSNNGIYRKANMKKRVKDEGERRSDYEAAAKLFKLMGHPVRLSLLSELARKPKCVSDIRDLVDLPQANVSQHLTVLREAGIVANHEQGNMRCYYLLRPGLVRDLLRLAVRDYPAKPQTPQQVRRAADESKLQKKGRL
jgi:ArsR family transcriptional regulator, arsenate/arsenite/antimonite-responsive transcriptional repressor